MLFPEDRSLLAVVYPTADRLKQLQAYAKETRRPLLIINPQWRNDGQVCVCVVRLPEWVLLIP